ncbi:MAG: hypothetical protein JW704_09550 [Anaerolineaceae bacterium]|nr:hypothetical protein [Anaerolineaceae bacterium]
MAIIGVLAVAVIFLLMRNAGTTTEPVAEIVVPQTETVDIVITTQKIGRGGEITADALTTIPYPKQDFIEGVFFLRAADVVGKWAKSDIEAHTPLTGDMIVSTLSGSYAAFQVPKGMVAVTIPISDRLSFVGYAPEAGDHINLIVTLLMIEMDSDFQSKLPNASLPLGGPGPTIPEKLPDSLTVYTFNLPETAISQGKIQYDATMNQPIYVVPTESQRPRVVSQTLLQDVLVLNVGDFKTQTSSNGTEAVAIPGIVNEAEPATVATTAVASVVLPDTITLVVAPQDAVTLTYLTYVGARFTLALRAPGDDQRIITQAGTLQFLLDQYNIPLPTKLPYGIEPRIDVLELPGQYQYILPTPTPES